MRTAKILLAVGLAILLDSTPSSSGSLAERPDTRPCLPGPAISLLSSSGGLKIALISSDGCRH